MAYQPSRVFQCQSNPLVYGECPRVVMVKAMDYGIVVSEFEIQSRYYVHFRTNTLGEGINPLILPAMGQIVSLLLFYNDGLGIK